MNITDAEKEVAKIFTESNINYILILNEFPDKEYSHCVSLIMVDDIYSAQYRQEFLRFPTFSYCGYSWMNVLSILKSSLSHWFRGGYFIKNSGQITLGSYSNLTKEN